MKVSVAAENRFALIRACGRELCETLGKLQSDSGFFGITFRFLEQGEAICVILRHTMPKNLKILRRFAPRDDRGTLRMTRKGERDVLDISRNEPA